MKFRRGYENIGQGYCIFILLQGRHELFPNVNLRSTRSAGCTSENLHNSCDIKLPVQNLHSRETWEMRNVGAYLSL